MNRVSIWVFTMCFLSFLILFSENLEAEDSSGSNSYRERFSQAREEPIEEGKENGGGGGSKGGKTRKKKKKTDDFRRAPGMEPHDPVVPITGVKTGDLTAVTYKSPTPTAPLLEKAWNSTAWAPTYQPASRSLLGEKGNLESVIQSDLIKHTGWKIDGGSISVSPSLNGGPHDVQTGQEITFTEEGPIRMMSDLTVSSIYISEQLLVPSDIVKQEVDTFMDTVDNALILSMGLPTLALDSVGVGLGPASFRLSEANDGLPYLTTLTKEEIYYAGVDFSEQIVAYTADRYTFKAAGKLLKRYNVFERVKEYLIPVYAGGPGGLKGQIGAALAPLQGLLGQDEAVNLAKTATNQIRERAPYLGRKERDEIASKATGDFASTLGGTGKNPGQWQKRRRRLIAKVDSEIEKERRRYQNRLARYVPRKDVEDFFGSLDKPDVSDAHSLARAALAKEAKGVVVGSSGQSSPVARAAQALLDKKITPYPDSSSAFQGLGFQASDLKKAVQTAAAHLRMGSAQHAEQLTKRDKGVIEELFN